MLFSRQPTVDAVAHLSRFRHQVDRKDIEVLLAAARKTKPPPRNGLDFDGAVEVLRANYSGCQSDRCRLALAGRYQATGADIPPVPLNVTTEIAELQASAYRQPATRRLTINGVDPLAPNSEATDAERSRAEAYRSMVKLSDPDGGMLEAERIAALAGDCFVKHRWSSLEAEFGRAEHNESTNLWPSQVDVIPNDKAPGKLWAAHAVIIHLKAVSPKERAFEIWVRDYVMGSLAEEVPTGARWFFGRFTSKGRTLRPMAPYELPDIPLTRVTHSAGKAAMFHAPQWDLITFQDEVNIKHSDNAYRMAYQSHLQVAVVGAKMVPGSMKAWGPAEMLDLPEGASVTTIPSDYDNTGLDGIEQMVRMHAHSKRLAVDAFFTKGGNPETGTAREIRREFSDQKRDEHLAALVECDREAMRVQTRIADRWAGLPVTIDGPDADYTIRHQIKKRFEDPTQKQARIDAAEAGGYISKARAAVDLGFYADEAEAVAAGLSPDIRQGVERTGATVNELSLSAQRFASFGDVDGVNLARSKWGESVGEDLGPVEGLTKPAPDSGDPE